MEFNQKNYPTIKKSCEEKQGIGFFVSKSATCFSDSEAPSDWTAYPPASLTKEAYAQIFVHAGTDARGTLTKLELAVHLDGGRILYKKRDDKFVDIQVTF
ncbi:hypothetical protein [Shewanella spartinae]|uniref:hypothetical protein n=1 Tax=Shewanella spartinae TaxID=2864205 RepID=UPI001C65E53C|nr:hypothetical protein [Shewanella spartinae]QYJ93350.1 hypothetical protein K0I31_17435 [Shewanella spartinae]